MKKIKVRDLDKEKAEKQQEIKKLDKEIEIAEKKLKLAQLKKELEELEGGSGANDFPTYIPQYVPYTPRYPQPIGPYYYDKRPLPWNETWMSIRKKKYPSDSITCRFYKA